MAVGLYLQVSNGATSFERAFMRLPVMIGRSTKAARCVVQNPQVSKLHACLDIQEGTIRVRDVGSTNGTYVLGRRLAPNRWVRAGAVEEPLELKIGDCRITASVYRDDTTDLGASSLAELADEIPNPSPEKLDAPVRVATPAHLVPEQPSARVDSVAASKTFEIRGPALRLALGYANAMSGMDTFYGALGKELDAAPPEARAPICRDLVSAHASLADDPQAREVLECYGWCASSSQATVASLGGAALAAMQELASRYVGAGRTLATPAEVSSFKDKLRATLDEFLLAYPALVEGKSRFEQQLAIQPEPSAALPSSPAQLAAVLLDWLGSNDSVHQRLRATFAELMMHEVALLNGFQSGVAALLTELSPTRIEKAAGANRRGLFSRADPWTLYKRRHSDLADEENERFRLLFGPEFVEEYRQFTREAQGPKTLGPPPGMR
jgi:type VI secretion system protein ImpI